MRPVFSCLAVVVFWNSAFWLMFLPDAWLVSHSRKKDYFFNQEIKEAVLL